MTDARPIGTTKGPGETPHEFTFVGPDPDQQLKYGEFVYYQAAVDGRQQSILGRVVRRTPLRLYPDAFMLDPEVSPGDVARMLGKASRELRRMSADLPRLALDEEKPEPLKRPAINRRSARATDDDAQDADTDSSTGNGGPAAQQPDDDPTTDSNSTIPERRKRS